jgi:hypothetical protein
MRPSFSHAGRHVYGETMSDMDDAGQERAASGEAVFAMDPEQTLRELARQLVDGQKVLANLTRTAHKMRQAAPDNPDVRRLLTDVENTTHQWLTQTLPSLAASMKVALEVYETFGPGSTTIVDATDAAIWNNKYFVWHKELSGQPLDGPSEDPMKSA